MLSHCSYCCKLESSPLLLLFLHPDFTFCKDMLPTISNVQTMEQMRRQRYIRYYTSRNKPGSKCLLIYTSCKWYFLNTAPFPRNILKKYFAKQIRNQDPTLNYLASYINMDWICREAPVAAPLSCRWNNSCRRLEDDRVEYRIPSSALNLLTLRTHDIISLCFYDCLWSPIIIEPLATFAGIEAFVLWKHTSVEE